MFVVIVDPYPFYRRNGSEKRDANQHSSTRPNNRNPKGNRNLAARYYGKLTDGIWKSQ